MIQKKKPAVIKDLKINKKITLKTNKKANAFLFINT